MKTRFLPLSMLCVLIGSPLWARDSDQDGSPTPPEVEHLLAAADAARETFRPMVEADLRRARSDLSGALQRLERRLAADGPNGEAWDKYLRLDDLRNVVSEAEMPLDALESAYRRFNAGHYGLNRVWFADVRDAILRYDQVARAMQTAHLEKEYRQYVESLGSYLHAYAENPNAEQAVQIGEAIEWLATVGQAPTLVEAVREEFAKPNVFLTASRRLVAGGIEDAVDETEPVSDIILGTHLFGTGHTRGEVSVTLVPNDHHAVFDVIFLGTTRTRNTGYNGPVVVTSRGTTGIGTVKRFWVNRSGLHSQPARANATTSSDILDIRSQRGGRLVERIGWRRAMQQKHQAEAIATQRAAGRASARLDTQTKPMLQEANDGFEHRLRRPMEERRVFLGSLQLSSCKDTIRAKWLQAGPAQLAAPDDPPTPAENADLTLRVHESMVNNVAQNTLTGLSLSDAELRMALMEILGRVPVQLEPVPGDDPWTIMFDRDRPAEVRFADGGLHITIWGRRYKIGERLQPAMNISARYWIVRDETGFRAVREELDALPPDFTEGQRLPPATLILRRLLIRRFERIFEEEFPLEALELPDRWSRLGALPVAQVESDGGWLTIAWRIPEE